MTPLVAALAEQTPHPLARRSRGSERAVLTPSALATLDAALSAEDFALAARRLAALRRQFADAGLLARADEFARGLVADAYTRPQPLVVERLARVGYHRRLAQRLVGTTRGVLHIWPGGEHLAWLEGLDEPGAVASYTACGQRVNTSRDYFRVNRGAWADATREAGSGAARSPHTNIPLHPCRRCRTDTSWPDCHESAYDDQHLPDSARDIAGVFAELAARPILREHLRRPQELAHGLVRLGDELLVAGLVGLLVDWATTRPSTALHTLRSEWPTNFETHPTLANLYGPTLVPFARRLTAGEWRAAWTALLVEPAPASGERDEGPGRAADALAAALAGHIDLHPPVS